MGYSIFMSACKNGLGCLTLSPYVWKSWHLCGSLSLSLSDKTSTTTKSKGQNVWGDWQKHPLAWFYNAVKSDDTVGPLGKNRWPIFRINFIREQLEHLAYTLFDNNFFSRLGDGQRREYFTEPRTLHIWIHMNEVFFPLELYVLIYLIVQCDLTHLPEHTFFHFLYELKSRRSST